MDDAKSVEVHNFWTYDNGAESPQLSPFKATRDAIAKVWKGKLADGTEQVVKASDLDAQGRYRRIATGWGELN